MELVSAAIQTSWQRARLSGAKDAVRRARRAIIWHVEPAWPPAPTKCLAGCFFVRAAALKFLFAGAVIEAKSTASETVHKRPAGLGNGRLGNVIRQLPVVAPCT